MSSVRSVMRSGQIVQAPSLPDLVRTLWRRLRPHTRRRELATLSDHLLADVGLDGPGYEQPTWEHYIHRH